MGTFIKLIAFCNDDVRASLQIGRNHLVLVASAGIWTWDLMIFFSLYLSLGHTYGPVDFNGNMLVYNLFHMRRLWIEGEVCLKGLLLLKFQSDQT